jgi:hypothetical protein
MDVRNRPQDRPVRFGRLTVAEHPCAGLWFKRYDFQKEIDIAEIDIAAGT